MAGIVIAMIETFGPMGGAHMNPAVTLAMFSARRITILRGDFNSHCVKSINNI